MSESARSTDVAEYLNIMHPDGVYEGRIPKRPRKNGDSYKATAAGWFYSHGTAAMMIADQERFGPTGIYVTINPVRPDLLALAKERFEFDIRTATKDEQVERRRRLLIDIDPKRPSGVSSTDEEMQLALELGDKARRELTSIGWQEPLYGCSGNGCYLIYAIDLPNDGKDGPAERLVKNVLAALAQKYNTDAVQIDTTTFNASRVAAVLGTWKRKGDALCGVPGVAERPHRQSWFERPAEPLRVVSRELLEAMAAQAPTMETAKESSSARDIATGVAPFLADASTVDEERRARIRLYMEKIEPAVAGEYGHTQAFKAARALVIDWGLSVAEAMPFLQEWNRGCRPPWSDRELQRKLEESRDKGRGEVGRLTKSDQPRRVDTAPAADAGSPASHDGWRLIDRDTSPSSYWIYGPEWDGHVEVDHRTLCDGAKLWLRITDAKKVVPDKKRFVKKWPGRFKWLLEHREIIPAPPEQDRVAVVAGLLHAMLAAAERYERDVSALDQRGKPTVLPEHVSKEFAGDVVFKFNAILRPLSFETDKVTSKELSSLLHDRIRVFPWRCPSKLRWLRITQDQINELDAIGNPEPSALVAHADSAASRATKQGKGGQ